MDRWYNFVARTLVVSVFFVAVSAGKAPAQLIHRNTSSKLVLNTVSPPILGVVESMVVAEGDTLAQTVHASDPDGDYLGFSGVNFFPFMQVHPISPGPMDARAEIVLTPRAGDRGRATVGIRVTDGVFNDEVPFNITVLEKHPGSTWLALRVEPRPWEIVWDSVRFDDLDGAFSATGTAETGVTVTFDPPEPLMKNASVTLSCVPAQRPACMSDRVNWWQLRFEPPLGATLGPGLYGGAAGSPDEDNAGLQVRPFCGSVRSCTVADSWFKVREVVFDLAGALVSFWATFERRCSDSPTGVSGEIRYNASPSLFVNAPSRVMAHAGELLEVDIPVKGTASEPRSVVSPDLPPGASLSMVTQDLARLAWTPALNQAGNYEFSVIAQGTPAVPDTMSMVICVDVPGALTARMDANRTTVITTNRGDAAYDAARNAPGVLHPTHSDIPVANEIGLAIAAKVAGDIRLSLGYSAYAAGPLIHGAPAPFAPEFKNYTIRHSEPSGYDWDHWPFEQGAPVEGAGRPLILGDATIWSLYNDARVPLPPEPPRVTAPLGVEVRQTTWANASVGPLGDVVFQRFEIRNAGADTLDEAYVGLLVNAKTYDLFGDVGDPSRSLAGCDTTLGLGYAYTAEYCGRPNAVGVAILRGPVESAGVSGPDTLGLTAFQNRLHYGSGAERIEGIYNQLRGLFPDGQARHEFDDPAFPATPYAFTGDPIAGTGWLYPPPCYMDPDFYASTGPFRLLPGQEQEVLVAIVAATGSDRFDAVRRIREAAAAAREMPVPDANRTPVAAAGGPYHNHAGAPIEFDASGSFDPDGDALSFAWRFGDGAQGSGMHTSHSYGEDGVYSVVLIVSDQTVSDSDTTTAQVGTLSVGTGAEAHLLPGDSIIHLASSRPYAWIAVEPLGGLFRPSDIELATVTLTRVDGLQVPIVPVKDKSRPLDEDGDGVQEMALAFSKVDLRTFLADLRRGRSDVPAVVTGDLREGGRFEAPVTLVVDTGRPGLHASVAPNPFNPEAVLTIHTSRAGRVRVSLFNAAGQLVRTLLDAPVLPPGFHDIAVDRYSSNGALLASGIYFYRVEALEGSTTGRFVILK